MKFNYVWYTEWQWQRASVAFGLWCQYCSYFLVYFRTMTSIYPEWNAHFTKQNTLTVSIHWCLTSTRALRWRHNDHAGVSNHQPPGCLLNRLFRRKSKKTSKLRVTGLCAGNSPGTGEFSAQMASYAENVSIWWRHHGVFWRVSVLSSPVATHKLTNQLVQPAVILTHLPLDKMAAISQTTFSDAFWRMKSFVFWSKFHWSSFIRVQLTIAQHWIR